MNEAETLNTDPAGDVIHPRIQYLEQWIRDCQRYNRNVGAQLEAAEAKVRDLETLVAAKNLELGAAHMLALALHAGDGYEITPEASKLLEAFHPWTPT